MLGQAKSLVIVYVDRNRLQFYGGSLSSILMLDIPPAIIKDLEVLNRDGLYTLVKEWIRQNALGSARLFLVLSQGTYFDTAATATSDSERETEILAFYDRVPFEELITKIIPQGDGKRAFAMNKLYLDAIAHAFLLQGLQVEGAVPVFLLGTIASKRWLDAEMGAYILKHVDTLKQFNVLEGADESLPAAGEAHEATTKSNPRLMMMVGIFGVLLLVLIVIIFSRS